MSEHSLIDHLVITAPTLEAGREYVYRSTGVMPQGGGRHGKMGTYNSLLGLGNGIYLEVLAIDPGAPNPGRARWFELDRPEKHARPKLTSWVVFTPGIHARSASLQNVLGNVESMSRPGLEWLLTVTPDGSMHCDGCAPALIEWPGQPRPGALLPDSGSRFIRLEIFHNAYASIDQLLKQVDFRGEVYVNPPCDQYGNHPCLVAHLSTPKGPVQLTSC